MSRDCDKRLTSALSKLRETYPSGETVAKNGVLTLEMMQEAYDKIMDTPVCADFSDYRNGKLLANCEKDYHDDPLYQALTMVKFERDVKEVKQMDKTKERYGAAFYDETVLSKECPAKEEDHAGQTYNPYTDTWSWM